MNPTRALAIFTFAFACALTYAAQETKPEDGGLDGGKGGHWGLKSDKDWIDARWNNVDVGPFVSCALAVPGGNVNKGIAIRASQGAAVCFDSARTGICAAWTGPFVKFSGKRYGLIEPPAAAGQILFSIPGKDLWNGAATHYRGLYLHGDRVTLSYSVNSTEILESPGSELEDSMIVVTRNMQVNAPAGALTYTLAGLDGAQAAPSTINGLALGVLEKDDQVLAAGLIGGGATVRADASSGRLLLEIAPQKARIELKVLMWEGKKSELPTFAALVKRSAPAASVESMCQPGPVRWGQPLITKGALGSAGKPYEIDSIAVPFNNPFKALFFCSGLDFLDNGDAVISTLHGDVWLVSGIDDKLQNVTWRRFATGLFQSFGVKVVQNRIYVLGRDQITLLHDTNNDGEADYYENFCNAANTSAGGHDYSAGLESDSAGNLYHVDPFGLHRISKTGDKYETVASGWRNPISLAVGPDDSIVVSPQEGEWTPASQICEVKHGGYYGFPGPKAESLRPLGYDPPLCYIPRLVDNSTGGLLWAAPAEPAKWGPLAGHLFDLSFGQCSLNLVLREYVDGSAQGGIVPLGLRFPSGSIRGRMRKTDGQLYVVGTQGWVTSAVRDGCFQRVRYTGAKLCVPIAVKTQSSGMQITFSEPLEPASAEDAENYAVEQWNYHYGAQYGSREYSVEHPEVAGHDAVELSSAKLMDQGRTVLLSILSIKPVMQIRIKYHVKTTDGEPVRGEIDYTINKVGNN